MVQIEDDEIQELAMQSGSLVLECGGETYRAEETVLRVAKALGAKEASSFITPTIVILSWENSADIHFMHMNRILKRTTNLKKLALINDLSRKINFVDKKERASVFKENFLQIKNTPSYSPILLNIAAAISSFCFALMLSGTFLDSTVAFFISFVVRIVTAFFENRNTNTFIKSVLQGLLIAILATSYSIFNPYVNIEIATISALMIVVPGIMLVNSIRDVIAGDLMAGTARFVEAVMIATGLSIGASFGYVLVEMIK